MAYTDRNMRAPAAPFTRRAMLAGAAGTVLMGGRAFAQGSPAVPPAVIDNQLEIEGEALAAKLAQNRMSVEVMVNGHGPLRFTVDSGADRTVIGASVAQALGLKPGDTVLLHSTTGSERVGTVPIDELRIGNSLIHNIDAPALPERFIGADGLLGIDALADQRLLLDFERRKIVVQDTRRVTPSVDAGEIVVVARRRKGQLILTEASAGPVGIYAIIDSGSEVTVGNSALRQRLFERRRVQPTAQPVEIISVTGGRVVADGVALNEMRVGGITLRGVSVAFFDAPPFRLFGLERQPAMLLGTDVLGAFARVSLDFRARKVRFRLRA